MKERVMHTLADSLIWAAAIAVAIGIVWKVRQEGKKALSDDENTSEGGAGRGRTSDDR